MNELQILTALAELKNKLAATHERIFEINLNIQTKPLSKPDKTAAYMILNDMELQKETIIKDARILAKRFLSITTEPIN